MLFTIFYWYNSYAQCNQVAPYVEDFDGAAGATPSCWTESGDESWNYDNSAPSSGHIGDNGSLFGSTTSGGYFAWIDDSGSQISSSITSPVVDISALTSPSLQFYWVSYNEGNHPNASLEVEIFDGVNWILAGVFSGNTGNTPGEWVQEELDLSAFGSSVEVRFTIYDSGEYYDDIAIDDIAFDNGTVSCYDPTVFQAVSVSDVSATVSWLSGASSWDIEYGVAGFTPTGTPTNASVSSSSYMISNLTAQTSYDVYVRADCGGGDLSNWVGPVTFTTACGALTAPYVEDFETAAGSMPNCWSQDSGNQKDWEFANSVGSDHIGDDGDFYGTTSASGGYFAFVDDSSPHETGTGMVTAAVDVSGLVYPTLSFYYVSDNEGNSNVDFSVDIYDGATWQNDVFVSSTNTNGWKRVYLDLSVYTISGPVRARFVIDENNGTDFYDDVAIDDVSFDEAPPCLDPENILVSNVASNSVDISWDDNNIVPVSQYNIEYGIQGFTPGSGTTVVATSNPFTLSGLIDDTAYEFYIQTECSANDLSSFMGPYGFNTLIDCSPYALDVTSVTDDSVCGGGTVTLGASVSGNGSNTYWYGSETGDDLLGLGSDFSPEVSSTTSFWVSEVYAIENVISGVGLTNWDYSGSSSAASNYRRGLYFNATNSFVINTVDVFDASSSGGSMNVELYNTDNNELIESAVVSLPGGGSSSSPVQVTLTLDFLVSTPGNYKLVANDSPSMKYEYGFGENYFPQAIGSSGEILEGGYSYVSTSTGTEYEYSYDYYYYYFYNWEVSEFETQCESTRLEVVATVNDVADEEVVSLPYNQSETTSNYGNNYEGASGCGSDMALMASDVVYHYQATDDYIMSVQLSGLTSAGSSVFVYESCADIGSACLAGEVNAGMQDYGFEFSAVDGEDYYIVVSGEANDYNYTIDISGETCANYSAPSGSASQDFLSGQKLADLKIIGGDLKFYSDAAGTLEVSPYTLLNNGDVYYVSRNFDGCESALLMITVNELSCTELEVVNSIGGEICDEGSAVLYAEGSGVGNDIYWYTTPSGGSSVAYGNQFETPSVSQTSSFWASEVAYTKEVLEDLGLISADNSPSSNSSSNYGLAFNTQQPMEIVDVTVYSTTSDGGDITVAVKDANTNEILMDKVFTLPSGGSESSPLPVILSLGFEVDPGQYRLLKTTGPALLREGSFSNQPAFPFPLGANASIVAGSYSTSNTSTYYNFFFDWTIVSTEVVCESLREEVQVVRKGLPGAPYGNTGQTVCTGSTLSDLVVDGDEIYWYDSSEGGDPLPMSTLLQDQTFYYASQVVDGCEGEDRINVIVTVTDTGSDMPTGDAVQTFDTGEFVSDLDVEGENLIWYYDAAGTMEIIDPQNEMLQNGVTYYVSQTIGAQCESDLLAVTADEVLGLTNHKINGLDVYPNPMKSKLNIDYTSDIESVQIFDLIGKKVLSVDSFRSNSKTLDVSHLASGAYILRITVKSGTGVYKLIKE